MGDRGPQHRRNRDILTAAIPHVLAQARGCLHGIEKRDTHTLLALRAIILHWCLDGILRLQGALPSPPSPSRGEARYKEAFHIFTHKTPSELLDQLADLVQVPERDWPGVKALLILLLSLDALNLETRRRVQHRGIRKQWEAIRQGAPDAQRRLTGLLRTTHVFGTTLAQWGGLPKDAEVEAEAQDSICLQVLGELVKKQADVLTDLTVGKIPAGPFAALYPVRKRWWGPVAARLVAQDILQVVRALHPEVDDSLERYPLEAKDRLLAYRQTFGRYQWPAGESAEPSCEPAADADTADWMQRLEAFVCTSMGRRTWRAVEARMEGKTEEQAARVGRMSRRELSRRLETIQAWCATHEIR